MLVISKTILRLNTKKLLKFVHATGAITRQNRLFLERSAYVPGGPKK